ncbi:MAG: DoxX family protein [Flavisolibacter sp.]|jgi:putative oxidoreductase|nr:DoxX family protein [Flavisolibacter sp.]
MFKSRLFNTGSGIFLLRLFVGVRLIYGTIDNILDWDRMKEFESFLASQGFIVPLISAVVSVYAQFICGILILIGWKIRWAGIIMTINFLVASYIELPRGFELMTPALAIFFSSLVFFFEGAGRYSIDQGRNRGIKVLGSRFKVQGTSRTASL